MEIKDTKIFKNWQKYGLISLEDFTENWNWVNQDPLDETGHLTRSMGLEVTKDMETKALNENNPMANLPYDENNLQGKIVRLERKWVPGLDRYYFYKDGKRWNGDIILSKRDHLN